VQNFGRSRIQPVLWLNWIGQPVTVLIDISPHKSLTSIETKVPVPGAFWSTTEKLEFDPAGVLPEVDVETFIRELKFFATDVKVMHCAFVASEGLQFQPQAYRENRFHIFISQELTIQKAKLVLERYNVDVDETHLKQIPRTFITLSQYAKAVDKEGYVKKRFSQTQASVRRLPKPYKNLLRKACIKPIGYVEISAEKLSEEDVVKTLVATNLLTLNELSEFEIQFDVVVEAIKLQKE